MIIPTQTNWNKRIIAIEAGTVLMKHNKNSVKLADVPATNKSNACFKGTRCLENRSVIASKIIQPNKYWLQLPLQVKILLHMQA